MKRNLAFILALVMILTTMPINIFAEEIQEDKLKEAIVKSKEWFDIGNEYDKFNQSVSSLGDMIVFNLNWSDSKEKLGEINVSITMDGLLLNYSKWEADYGEKQTSLPSINKEEGLKIAKDFIEKVSPDFSEKIKYIDKQEPLDINSETYDYYFVRVENDIPYYNNSLSVYVDNSTGKVSNYNTNWDMDIDFTDTKDIISLEKAKELYREKIGLELIYKLGYENREPNMFLAYGPLNTNLGIKAKDGEIALIQRDYEMYGAGEEMAVEDAASAGELTPDEERAVNEISNLISREEAEKYAREILEIDEEYKLTNMYLFKNWRNKDEYNWEISFEKDLGGNYSYGSIAINAKTKKLLNFYRETPSDLKGEIQINKEESLVLAKEFIKKFNPEEYNQIEVSESFMDYNYDEGKKYNFNFIRKIDGAYVENNGISIYVDAINARVEQYSFTWDNNEFPSRDNLISLDKAYDVLFNDIELELKYGKDPRSNDEELILVYGLKNDKPNNIDPKTGKILNDSGKAYKKPTITYYKDIEDSYAKEKINILAEYGIALEGEEFKPKEKMLQKEFLYLLLKAKNPYYGIAVTEENLYKQLINGGIIKEEEKSPEKVISKEEAVLYLIRALDYEKVADLSDIYKDIFKDTEDIKPELKGHISIAYGLKIVHGYKGNLNPKAELKREDGANMIYNLIFNGK